MLTLIDGSCLLRPQPTGVTAAAWHLLESRQLDLDGNARIVTYGRRPPTPEQQARLPYAWDHHPLPSKAVHALCSSGLASFDRLFGPADRLLLPNINITGQPRTPYDLVIHDLSFLVEPSWFSWKSRAWHWLARPKRLILGAERLFAVSAWTKADLVERLGADPERITVVRLEARNDQRPRTERPLAGPYFLLLNGEDARKNAEVARRAFAAFHERHPDWTCVLTGMRGPAAEAGIKYLPYLAPAERERWLQHAAALLYPSWYEGFGLPCHEAARRGVPVLAAGNGALAETAPRGTVWLPPHKPHLWQQAMEDIARKTERTNQEGDV